MEDIIKDNYIVKFVISSQLQVEFNVYPICHYKNGNKAGILYESKESLQLEVDEFNEQTCLREMSGFINWRGCWDERVYFDDGNEYWGSSFIELSKLFQNEIVPLARKKIQEANPQYITDKEFIKG